MCTKILTQKSKKLLNAEEQKRRELKYSCDYLPPPETVTVNQ